MASLSYVLRSLRELRQRARLTPAARQADARDAEYAPTNDPGIAASIAEAAAWLGRAQDHSATAGGVARHYSLINGWGPAYPESTGYIVPTMLQLARKSRALAGHRERARHMLDWLLTTQLPCGGFQGGTLADRPIVPVAFNTGQILLGLAAGADEFGAPYLNALHRASTWLVGVQDSDGCWRRHESPFACSGPKTYDAHASWGLLEAASASGEASYADAAAANIRWAIEQQRPNGWFPNCCLTDATRPLTHTLGYALRGVIEGYRHTRERRFLASAMLAGDGLLKALKPNGFIPGRLDPDWQGAVAWSCLTGTSQIAHCWLQLFQETGQERFLEAGKAANAYVRCSVDLQGPLEIRGAVKGSFPISGGYAAYQYPNWAAKFFIDANLLEDDIVRTQTVRETQPVRIELPATGT